MKKKENKKTDVPAEFRQWWEPYGHDKITGASKGGHPDAWRLWARPEANGLYTRRFYGIKTKVAWITEFYRQQFDESGGTHKEDFISVAATKERQKEH